MINTHAKNKTEFDEFQDILRDRRKTSDFLWASRNWNPVCAYAQTHKPKPNDITSHTLSSYQLKETIKELSYISDVPVFVLEKAVHHILKEIAYKRAVTVLRWLAFLMAKILKNLYLGVMVNEGKFLKMKSKIGRNPVLLVPNHRSYGDFILMSYVCFHYDVDIPRIAAGMDFHSMTLMGRILRNSCAFFMRRSFSTDKLYAAVFSQYVQSLITNGDSSIEFFIEGTRSRTAKSLVPKYGFLSMALRPFFTGLVPDVTLLPVSFSYDCVMEDVLFAYELLGVPKPKESTKGFIKALSILRENLGYAYVNFGEPISVKEFFGNGIDRSVHNFGPVELQQLTSNENKQIVRLAHNIVRQQQNLSVITCFNLIATVINHRVSESGVPLGVNELVSEINWLLSVLRGLGATVAVTNVSAENVQKNINLHKSLVTVTVDGKIKLLRIHSATADIDKNKMKGHCLSNKTIDFSIPLLMIQYYSNPCAHLLVNLCFISLIVQLDKNETVSIGELFSHFQFLRSVFSDEFVLNKETEETDFNSSFEFSKNQKAVVQSGSDIKVGENRKLCEFCSSFFRIYISGYLIVIDVLLKEPGILLMEKNILKNYQGVVESLLTEETRIHPASLSLDMVTNALQAFVHLGAATKLKRENEPFYELRPNQLEIIKNRLRSFDLFGELNLEISEHLSSFMNGKL